MRRFTLKVVEPVDAELLLRTPSGDRPPTEDELGQLDFVSQRELLRRRRRAVAALGLDDDDDGAGSSLRYFLEYVTDYGHDVPEEALAPLRRWLQAEAKLDAISVLIGGEAERTGLTEAILEEIHR